MYGYFAAVDELHLSFRVRGRRSIRFRPSRGRHGKSLFDTSSHLCLTVNHHVCLLQNAAKRMVVFWAMRHKFCGEAASLSLVAIGDKALNTESVALLNGGHIVRLLDDSEGRTVIYIDRSWAQNSGEFRNAMLQLILLACMVLKEESSQKKGLLVVNGKVRRPLFLDCSWKYSITFCPPC
jgi:hypothetical protein